MKGGDTLAFDGIWKALPKDNTSPLLDATKVIDKTFEFNLTCSGFDETKKFSLRYRPGYPAELRAIVNSRTFNSGDSMLVDMSVDEKSSPIALLVFDRYGNRTGPERGDKWIVMADSGPIKSFSPIEINADGILILDAINLDESELGVQQQALQLITESNHNVLFQFNVNIKASRRPCQLKVVISLHYI